MATSTARQRPIDVVISLPRGTLLLAECDAQMPKSGLEIKWLNFADCEF